MFKEQEQRLFCWKVIRFFKNKLTSSSVLVLLKYCNHVSTFSFNFFLWFFKFVTAVKHEVRANLGLYRNIFLFSCFQYTEKIF